MVSDEKNPEAQEIAVLFMLIVFAKQYLGDRVMTLFLDKVPETGMKLWDRYRAVNRKEGLNFIEFVQQIANTPSN